jgi:hypothetical protein
MASQNWCLYEFLPQINKSYPYFRKSPFFTMVLVFAKKTKDSTFDKMPVQTQYRDKNILQGYLNNIQKII